MRNRKCLYDCFLILKYGGTNFTAFRIIDTNRQEVKDVVRQIVNKQMNAKQPVILEVICLLFISKFDSKIMIILISKFIETHLIMTLYTNRTVPWIPLLP